MPADDDEPLAHPHDPRVRAVSRAVLLDNRWPKHDLEDGVDDVEFRAWASQSHPTTLGGWKALCRTIAKAMTIDRGRSEKVDGKASEKPTDRADEHLSAHSGEAMEARIDRQRAIQEMRAMVAPEELPVFDRWALGYSKKEIGLELNMKPKEVGRKVSSMRARFQKALPAVAVFALLAVGAYFVFRTRLGPDDQAHNGPQPSSVPSPAPSAPPGPTPEELAEQQRQADGLRQLAVADCTAGRWDTCTLELQSAGKLDPKGDTARSVQRLRGEAKRGQDQDAFESKGAPGARSLAPTFKPKLLAALAPSSGQSLRLVCATAPEPSQLCDQLSAAIKSAGWTVTRAKLAADAGVVHGMVIDVATDADAATQNAADALAAGLGQALLRTRGPRDAPAGGDAPLRLTVGVQ